MTEPVRRLLLGVAAAAALAACGDGASDAAEAPAGGPDADEPAAGATADDVDRGADADVDREPGGDLADAVEALLDAHDALLAHAETWEAGDHDAAVAEWSEVDAQVQHAVAVADAADAEGLSPRERSSLVGFRRGLQVARDAYGDVHDETGEGDREAVDAAVDQARDRLDALHNLRDGLPGR